MTKAHYRTLPLVAAALVAAVAVGGASRAPVLAQNTTPAPYVPPPYVPAPLPTIDPRIPTYDDRSVHFEAPIGWKRVSLAGASDDPGDVHVVFVEDKGFDSATIGLTIGEDDSGLDKLFQDRAAELRTDPNFTEQTERGHLANGMPDYFLESSSGTDVSAVRRYELLVSDGRRRILLTESARRGLVDETTARSQLSTLRVVVYPARPL